ncbi:MAG TPA: FAD-dependent oxidoreductase [Rhodanobacteraceae bacterium]|jgi:dimethylglycine dehydrogenase|nr:FAD-dependent oxidoreductase [Rhodanobacteraceae bacterium]
MKSHYRVVVIGGGIVGSSVLYHLAKFGWTDVALIERGELTCGSTWHAAGGFHALNDDPNIAALQGYTIRLYDEIQRESGVSVGMHMTGGISLAASTERMEMLRSERSMYEAMEIETRLVTPEEIGELCPIVDVSNLQGGLYDANEGYMDPHGTTHAYIGAAKIRGADVILRNRVVELQQFPDGRWSAVTENGTITADHIVNAAGLWARKVGRMVGVNLPVTPMQHHYLITEDVPALVALDREIVSITDLEGFTYLQPERKGVLLGIYERDPRHWKVEGADWDFGMDLLPPDIDRILPELSIGFERFPALQNVGIRRWVNGAFTFTPDGNPLVGPVPGKKNYWVACGCMGGFSQGGAIGLTLAQWMINGDPGADIFGMDVARYGAFAAEDSYLKDMTRQFYARRFVISYPNEELPAGRPLKASPCYDALKAEGAVYGCTWAMETPQFFAPGQSGFVEQPTLRRSNAHDFVAAEVRATREAAGMFESAVYARYEVSGPGAAQWLDHLLAARLPRVGRVRLAPMLGPSGKLMGDLTVSRLADDCFWLIGSYYLQAWHMRWFDEHLPPAGVTLRNLSDAWMGFAMSGPASREIISQLVDRDMSNAAFTFMSCTEMQIAGTNAVVARLSLTGELGYEINVPVSHQLALYEALKAAGRNLGLRSIGNRALDSLRLEKSYGVWNSEFTQACTPGMSNLERHVAFDKGDFIGCEAALRERDTGSEKVLVTLSIDATDADASGFEPVKHNGKLVGCVTSGACGHYVKQSLALAYVDRQIAISAPELSVDVVGAPRAAKILAVPAYDPAGLRLRS